MQEYATNTVDETKRLIRWIGKNTSIWEGVCGNASDRIAYWDSIEIIEELQKNEFYPQILSYVFNSCNGIEDIAISAITEEILETWGKEQWDEVIKKMIASLNKSHQAAKKQRVEKAAQLSASNPAGG